MITACETCRQNNEEKIKELDKELIDLREAYLSGFYDETQFNRDWDNIVEAISELKGEK